jgi:hypothetical protein
LNRVNLAAVCRPMSLDQTFIQGQARDFLEVVFVLLRCMRVESLHEVQPNVGGERIADKGTRLGRHEYRSLVMFFTFRERRYRGVM